MKRYEPEHRDYEIHYFYDARLSYPSNMRGYPKREESARAAAIVRIEAEQYNKAIIINRNTNEILHVLRRDRLTGAIWRDDHRYKKYLGESLGTYNNTNDV